MTDTEDTSAGPTTRPPSTLATANTLATEEGVYGVILVAGMIVVSNSKESTAQEVLITVVVTVLVFWAAHVYAGTVAHHGIENGRKVTLRESFSHALRRSLGMLVSSFVPVVLLALGAMHVIDEELAIWLALWSGVAVLAVLGYVAFARRGVGMGWRLLGAVGTAAFGVVLILLKAAIH